MPNDAVGDIVRVTVAALYPAGVGGQQVEECNVCYQCLVAGGADHRDSVGQSVYGIFQARLAGIMATSSKMYGYKVSSLGVYPPPVALTFVDNVAGSGDPSQAPTQCRGLISWKTAVGGRTGRGRVFVWTPDITQIDAAGNPGALYFAALGLLRTDLQVPVTVGGSTWALVVAHRGAGPSPPYGASLVTSGTVRSGWCTQRRSGESGRANANPW